jgi:hypothetical protein
MNRYRKSTREWCMDFATFKAADYGKLCQSLGLRPSKPHRPARKHGRR